MKEIKSVLEGQFDYSVAVELFKEYSNDSSMALYFASAPENSFNLKLLRKKLTELLSSAVSVSDDFVLEEKKEELSLSVSPGLTEVKFNRVPYDSLPENLQREYLHRNDLVRQADILKEKIRGCPDKGERYNLGLKLLRMWSEIKVIHGLLDNFASGNKKDSPPDFSKLTFLQLKDKLQKQMVLRSKAKSKVNTLKSNYHDELIRQIKEQINVQLQ